MTEFIKSGNFFCHIIWLFRKRIYLCNQQIKQERKMNQIINIYSLAILLIIIRVVVICP